MYYLPSYSYKNTSMRVNLFQFLFINIIFFLLIDEERMNANLNYYRTTKRHLDWQKVVFVVGSWPKKLLRDTININKQ